MQDWNYPMELPSWNASFTARNANFTARNKWACCCPPSWLTFKSCKYVQVIKTSYLEVPLLLSVRHSTRTITCILIPASQSPIAWNWGSQKLGYMPKATQLGFELSSSCAFFLYLSGFFPVSVIPSKSLSLPYPDPSTSSSNNKLSSSQYIYLFLVDSNRGKAVRCLFWLSVVVFEAFTFLSSGPRAAEKDETEAFRHLFLLKLSCLYYTMEHQGWQAGHGDWAAAAPV